MLNDVKTEFLILGASKDASAVTNRMLNVGQNEMLLSQSARYIGAYVDTILNKNVHINNTVRSCYFMWNLYQMVSHISVEWNSSIPNTSKYSELCNAFYF